MIRRTEPVSCDLIQQDRLGMTGRGAIRYKPASKIGRMLPFAFASLVVTAATAHSPPNPNDRAKATAAVREIRRIVALNGVVVQPSIRIGGIDPAVTIRGRDRSNPLLLVLRGGPGFPEAALAWWAGRVLEEYVTVAHWDQRWSGRTYLINDSKAVAATMPPERSVSDTEEVAAWLRSRFGNQKTFLLGHSQGYVGLRFAQHRPKWLPTYIGAVRADDGPPDEYPAHRHDNRTMKEMD